MLLTVVCPLVQLGLGCSSKPADNPLATVVIERSLNRERGQPRSNLILEDHGTRAGSCHRAVAGNNRCVDLDDVFSVLAGEPDPDPIGVASRTSERMINGLDMTILRPDFPTPGSTGNDRIRLRQLLDHCCTKWSNDDLRDDPGSTRKVNVDRHGVVDWQGGLRSQRWSQPSPPKDDVYDRRPNSGDARHAECSRSREAKGPDQHTAKESGRGLRPGWRQARQDTAGEDRVCHQRTGGEENAPNRQRVHDRTAAAVR